MKNRNSKLITMVLTSFVITSFFSVESSTVKTSLDRVKEVPLTIEPKPIKEIEIEPIDDLIQAMIMVESRGNDSAIGDTHLSSPSIGVLQIRPIMVREVNRILKITGSDDRFKLKDRFSREKSIEMFKVWYNYYHEDSEFETIARSWNGGPKGPTNSRTINYWNKVQDQLN